MSSLAIAETKKLEYYRRRKSLFNRNGVAKTIRELHENLEVQKAHNKHQNYLLKWAGEKDAEAYKKHLIRMHNQKIKNIKKTRKWK